MTKSLGVILLAIYLLIVAFLALTNLEIAMVNILQGVLAGSAAVCLLLGK